MIWKCFHSTLRQHTKEVIMKEVTVLLFLILLATAVSAQCEKAANGMAIDKTLKLCSENYVFEKGIKIVVDNIIVDCSGAVIQGTVKKGEFSSAGILIDGRINVTVLGCHLVNWEKGIEIKNSESIVIKKTHLIRNTIGIWLQNTKNSIIDESSDISISRPVRVINSTNNWLRFENKKLDGEECLTNVCNTPYTQQQTVPLQPTIFDQVIFYVMNGWLV